MNDITRLPEGHAAYAALARVGVTLPGALYARGAVDVLARPLLGVFASEACAAAAILAVYDTARVLSRRGVGVIGGFHSSVEDEVLIHALRGDGPVVVVYARGIHRLRLPGRFRAALAAGRLLLLSPFGESVQRGTAATAVLRNRVAAALADAVFVPCAAPGGKTESLCRAVVGWGVPLLTVAGESAAGVRALGASVIDAERVLG